MKRNFPLGSITIEYGTRDALLPTTLLNPTGLPTVGVNPSEPILNAWMPIVPPFGHNVLFLLRIVYA